MAEPTEVPALLPAEFVSPSMSLAQIAAILRAYRRAIAITVVSILVATIVVSKLLPKTYVATATLKIDAPTLDPDSGAEFSPTAAPAFMATQLDLIGSPTVLLSVVDQLGWAKDPKYTSGYSGDEPGAREYVVERVMAPNLKVVGGAKESHLVDISYAAHDRDTAALAANQIAKSYIALLADSLEAPSVERAKAYQVQLDTLRKKVDDAQAQLTQFRGDSGLIDLDQKVDVEAQGLLDMERQLVESEASERTNSLRLAQARDGAGADATVLDSRVIQDLKAQLSSLQARFADAATTLGPNHPDYRALKSQIAVVQGQLDREVGTYSESIRGQASTATSGASQLRKEIEDQRQKLIKIRSAQDKGESLQRELDSDKMIYGKALESYDHVVLAGSRRLPTAILLSPASPPLKHSKPITSFNAVLGLIAGLFFGVAGSLVWELTHRRIRCVEDLERDLGLPVLLEDPVVRRPARRRLGRAA